jgi:phenylpropionate dioxygenase-like ring-hydroxylating dioxygenase large terminal subunit
MTESVEELARQCSVPFPQARAMPKSVYTSEAFLQSELSEIFAKDWICVGRASCIANQGDYITCEIAGEAIIVIREGGGNIRAMSNVCRHRMSTLLEGSGTVRGTIVCPYHAWTYNPDGSLRGAPAMDRNDNFCKDDYRLPQIRCEVWAGWIMLSLDPDARPVATQLVEIQELTGDFAMEAYVESFRETHIWDTNWKILAENFMESYHLPVCHAGTIGGLSKLNDMVCPPGRAAFNYHTILKDDTLKIALAHPDNTRIRGERRRMTYLLAVYPSLLITLTPGYFWYLSLHPRGTGQVHITFGGGLSPEFAQSADARTAFIQLKSLLDEVNREDRGCTEKVYKGTCARHSEPGHLSHLERPNYDFAQYLAERVSGFQRHIENI